MIQTGKNYLLSLENYFVAPDGKQYKAVWGKCEPTRMEHPVKGLGDGFKNTRNSANYFISVDDGKFIVAGCQVLYAVQTDDEPFLAEGAYESDHHILARNMIYIPSKKLSDFIAQTWLDDEKKIQKLAGLISEYKEPTSTN